MFFNKTSDRYRIKELESIVETIDEIHREDLMRDEMYTRRIDFFKKEIEELKEKNNNLDIKNKILNNENEILKIKIKIK